MRIAASSRCLLTAFLVLALGCAGGWEVPSPSGATAVLKISGTVTKQGAPVDEALATLYPCAYHPPLPYSGITADSNLIPLRDSVRNGEYSFNLIDTGFYNLIVQDPAGSSVFLESLLVCTNSKTIQACSLAAPGRVIGTYSDSQGVAPCSSLVYLPGTGFFAYTNLNGAFAFDSLPAGTYDAKLDTSHNSRLEFGIYPNISVEYLTAGGDSVLLPPVTAQDAIAPPTFRLSSGGFAVQPSDTSYVIIKQ